MKTSQRFTAQVRMSLPDGVLVLSPAHGGDGYRLYAESKISAQDAIDKLVAAGFAIALDVQEPPERESPLDGGSAEA